jgi:hypothetical protein
MVLVSTSDVVLLWLGEDETLSPLDVSFNFLSHWHEVWEEMLGEGLEWAFLVWASNAVLFLVDVFVHLVERQLFKVAVFIPGALVSNN